jgi:hypothetical protein
MAQADVLTPAGEVRTRQGTFLNAGSGERPRVYGVVATRVVVSLFLRDRDARQRLITRPTSIRESLEERRHESGNAQLKEAERGADAPVGQVVSAEGRTGESRNW